MLDRNLIREKYATGRHTYRSLAAVMGCSAGTIGNILRSPEDDDPTERDSIVVIRDPTDLFSTGAEFRIIDLVMSAFIGGWPEGIEFRLDRDGRSVTAVVVDGRVVREDGCTLYPGKNGKVRWAK